MTVVEGFQFLQIDPTKDENEIKMAYRKLLSAYNPEDNPEGFKRLRSAFETAQKFARSSQSVEDLAVANDLQDASQGPIQGKTIYGISVSDELLDWMQELMKMCHSRHRRLDADEWIRMLRADVFQNLEDGENAEKVFFYFLSENYNHPSYIYRAIDQMTSFSVREDELLEFLPDGFIEYMCRKALDEDGDTDFPFEWLEGPDEADVEQFIREQFQLEELMMQGEYEKARQQAEDMKKYQLMHPHYEMELAKLEQNEGENEKAASRAKRIMGLHPGSDRLQLSGAEVLHKCGYKEDAFRVYQELSDRICHAVVQYRLAEANKEQGNLIEAIKQCCLYLDYHYDAALYQLADEIYNEAYETFYAKRPKVDLFFKLDVQQLEVLLDAFLHLMKCEEGLAYVKANKKKLNGQVFLSRYVGRYYFFLKNYEEAMNHCLLWREALQSEPESKEKTQMLARSYSYEAQIYFAQAEAIGKGKDIEERKKQKQLCMQAEAAIRNACETYNAVIYTRLLAKIFVLEGQGENAVMLMQGVVEDNPYDFISKMVLQEAYESNLDATGVLEIYEEFKEKKIPTPEVYERAANLFVDYNRIDDAKQVLEVARQLELNTPKMQLLELQILCRDGDPVEMEKQVRIKFRKMEDLYLHNPEEMPEDVIADAYYEIAVFLDMLKDGGSLDSQIEKVRYIRLALKHYETVEYAYTYGRFLLLDKKYADSLEWLMKAAKECEGHYRASNIYEHIGFAYGALGEAKLALEYYEKVLLVDPEHEQIHGRIGRIYTKLLKDSHNRMYVDLALLHVTKQLEYTPEDGEELENLYHICMETRKFDQAYEAAQKLYELYGTHYAKYLVANALMWLGRYTEAMEEWSSFLQSLNPEDIYKEDYILAGTICEKMGDDLNAIYWYERGQLTVRERDNTFLSNMSDLYSRTGNWEKEKRIISRMAQNREVEALQLSMIDFLSAKTPKEIKVVQRKIRALLLKMRISEKRADAEVLGEMAESYMFALNDYSHAKEYYEKAILYLRSRGAELSNLKYGGTIEFLRLMLLAKMRGESGSLQQYASQFMKLIEEEYANQDSNRTPREQYADSLQDDMMHLYDLAIYEILMDHFDEAEKIVDQLSGKRIWEYCMYCTSPECTDVFAVQAMLAEFTGQTEKAILLYEKANRADRSNLFVLWRLRLLTNQIEKG